MYVVDFTHIQYLISLDKYISRDANSKQKIGKYETLLFALAFQLWQVVNIITATSCPRLRSSKIS